MEYAYVRISTTQQDAALQEDAMRDAGVDAVNIWTETASGSQRARPVLASLLERVEAGDRLTVWRLDRLGRSLPHLIETLEGLRQRGVEFRSLTEAIDTASPGGRLVMHVIGAVAEFERDLIRERTAAGLAAARARGTRGGRPPSATPEQAALVRRLAAEDESHRRIAMMTGLSKGTVGRILRGEIAQLASEAT